MFRIPKLVHLPVWCTEKTAKITIWTSETTSWSTQKCAAAVGCVWKLRYTVYTQTNSLVIGTIIIIHLFQGYPIFRQHPFLFPSQFHSQKPWSLLAARSTCTCREGAIDEEKWHPEAFLRSPNWSKCVKIRTILAGRDGNRLTIVVRYWWKQLKQGK